jgi:hypothetical protein
MRGRIDPTCRTVSNVGCVNCDGNAAGIFALERPDPALRKLYVIRAVLCGPGILIALSYLYFRYHTVR